MPDTASIAPRSAGRRQAGEGADAPEAADSARFKQGMRRLAAGVSIVAATLDGARHGIVATAVSSVSADPPTLLVCISRSASVHDVVIRSGRFSVNVLAAADRALAEAFSTPGLRARRFEFGEWTTLHTGAPVLASALATFDCLTVEASHVASHTVFFGRVAGVRLSEGEIDPLLFWDGSYRHGPFSP